MRRLIAWRLLVTLGAALALAGCARASAVSQPAATVQRGDTRERVIALLGPPGDRQFRDDSEALQYCQKSGNAIVGNESGEYTVVWLYQNRVTGVTTYREALRPLKSCTSAFRSVNWQEAPDHGARERAEPPTGEPSPASTIRH